jgi:hypothetical protein
MLECELLAAASELEENNYEQFQEKIHVAQQSFEDLKVSFPILNKARFVHFFLLQPLTHVLVFVDSNSFCEG